MHILKNINADYEISRILKIVTAVPISTQISPRGEPEVSGVLIIMGVFFAMGFPKMWFLSRPDHRETAL